MPLNEAFDKEIRRLQYLDAMGIDSYIPRQVLPGGPPSIMFDWPESSIPSAQNVSDTIVAGKATAERVVTDKSALLQLQQELGTSQRKVPVTDKPANIPVSGEVQAKIPDSTAGLMSFQLAIFQPVKELLVMVPAQHTDTVHLQLLKNILLAIGAKVDYLVPLDNFTWPPRATGLAKTNYNHQAAQETLHSLLEGYQLKNHIKHILFFAGDLAEKLFPVEMVSGQALVNLNVLSLPDLQQMLEGSAYKKITWQKVRSLTL